MEILGLIISIIAILLSLFTYFKHDRKIKEQSKILNEYYIEKINNERMDAQKAIIEANVLAEEKGTRIIKIYNKGKSIAKNVNVSFPDIAGADIFINPCPIDIRPQNSIEIKMALYMGGPKKIDLTFEWTDDFKANNIDVQTIQI